MKSGSGSICVNLKLPALVLEIRQMVNEVLNATVSDVGGHQAFKDDKRVLALWAADCAERVLPFFEDANLNDNRPRVAIEACRNWAATGMFKMAVVRKASLDSHAAAREVTKGSAACYAARSAGHAVATAHVATHSFGSAAYAIKAVIANSVSHDGVLIDECNWQKSRLLDYFSHSGK